ncbi:PqqD family protein [Paenibacillus mesotrionivorans]|uniref:PqqD family protein n=1 Tax=Paenibacillus mesotrionivorans TaxID=3160968 RepID=A0ACC7P5T9_9BACL
MKLNQIDELIMNSAPVLKESLEFKQNKKTLGDKNLNDTGIWILEHLDGVKKVNEVCKKAIEKYSDVDEEIIKRDTVDFVYNLYQWGYLDSVNLPVVSNYSEPKIFLKENLETENETPARSGCGQCKINYIA